MGWTGLKFESKMHLNTIFTAFSKKERERKREREREQMKLQWFDFQPFGMSILVACNPEMICVCMHVCDDVIVVCITFCMRLGL